MIALGEVSRCTMLGTLSPRLSCSAMWRSAALASRLPQLSIRCITTKQPTKSTAAAPKLAEFDHLEQQQQQDNEEQAKGTSARQRWQLPSTKLSIKQAEALPVQTCETREEREERLRTTFFQYDPDADKANSLPPAEWRGIFHMFTRTHGMSSENIQLMRSVIDVDTQSLKFYMDQRNSALEIEDQSLRVERLRMLGPDLAAAHFVVFRDGRIRFHGEEQWRCRNPDDDAYDLPNVETPGLVLKDVDASNMKLIYEGLENLEGCTALESISLSRCPHADNWFVDRICYQHSESLLSLDLSYCPKMTIGAITAVARLTKLKRLNVTGLEIQHLALACMSLEDDLPGLEIIGINDEHQRTTISEEQVEKTHSYLKDLQSLKDGNFGKTL